MESKVEDNRPTLMFGGAAHARVLPEIMPSVTEYTTRAFEPIYNMRTSRSRTVLKPRPHNSFVFYQSYV